MTDKKTISGCLGLPDEEYDVEFMSAVGVKMFKEPRYGRSDVVMDCIKQAGANPSDEVKTAVMLAYTIGEGYGRTVATAENPLAALLSRARDGDD